VHVGANATEEGKDGGKRGGVGEITGDKETGGIAGGGASREVSKWMEGA
jgi:hypothetical protein